MEELETEFPKRYVDVVNNYTLVKERLHELKLEVGAMKLDNARKLLV